MAAELPSVIMLLIYDLTDKSVLIPLKNTYKLKH